MDIDLLVVQIPNLHSLLFLGYSRLFFLHDRHVVLIDIKNDITPVTWQVGAIVRKMVESDILCVEAEVTVHTRKRSVTLLIGEM